MRYVGQRVNLIRYIYIRMRQTIYAEYHSNDIVRV